MNARELHYRAAMALAWGLFHEGVMTEDEYAEIDRIMAKKYGVDSSTILCRNPLLFKDFRGNMSQTTRKGRDDFDEED